ncbi:hypothetical protein LEP1GSC125_3603 [Leptospira mayottensis 200901122]|uniref:Integrase catalytic domain-containing protein n=1 Tax=Leptospira mayottensis 200901122 TaxID=1193010 RepID=A0AA87MSC7_9LEPT|nr:hypothetical protein LEP1GSC125_3603 [Leptospira mayottensis 200901122]
MDFMSDSLYSGRRFRILNIIDDFGRFAVVTQTEFSIFFTLGLRKRSRYSFNYAG